MHFAGRSRLRISKLDYPTHGYQATTPCTEGAAGSTSAMFSDWT